MSRIKSVWTSDTYMTKGNALRHYISKGKKYLKLIEHADQKMQVSPSNLDDVKLLSHLIKDMLKEAADVLDCVGCEQCQHDDFGYCIFRGSNSMDDDKRTVFYCFPAIMKAWEKSLQTGDYKN